VCRRVYTILFVNDLPCQILKASMCSIGSSFECKRYATVIHLVSEQTLQSMHYSDTSTSEVGVYHGYYRKLNQLSYQKSLVMSHYHVSSKFTSKFCYIGYEDLEAQDSVCG